VGVVSNNENIIFALTERGGHLAWLEGWDFWEEVTRWLAYTVFSVLFFAEACSHLVSPPTQTKAWMDRAVVEFSNALWNHMPAKRLQDIQASGVSHRPGGAERRE